MKKVSVIVPIYKGNRYIPNLFQMLEHNWETANKVGEVQVEMVLVNDSPTEELEIGSRERQGNVFLVTVSNTCNCGIHFSRVHGLLRSSGEYVVFLDQDDEISPVYIREQLAALGSRDAVICNGKDCNNIIYNNTGELDRAVDGREYRKGNRIVSPGQVLIRKSSIPADWTNYIMKKNGADDYFLWMLMFCNNRKIGIHDKVLYCHLISETNTSNNQDEMNASVIEMAGKMKMLGYLSQEEEQQIKESRRPPIISDETVRESYLKEKKYKRILEIWMTLRDRNIKADHFLLKRNMNRIAIYGVGILGRHLYHDLKETRVKVECFLDQNKKAGIPEMETYLPGRELQNIDAIIVTPLMEYEEIKEMLSGLYTCHIISLETVLLNADCGLQGDTD